MKFSKVNNLRAGVRNEAGGKTGILYQDPSKNSKAVRSDLKRHVRKQISSAKRLYHVFNTDSSEKDSIEKKAADAFQDKLEKILTVKDGENLRGSKVSNERICFICICRR